MIKDNQLYFNDKMPSEEFPIDVFRSVINNPGMVFHLHWHEHLQFILIEKGKMHLIINSIAHDVQVGDIVVINSCDLHYAENIREELIYHTLRVDFSILSSQKMDACQMKYISKVQQNKILFKNIIRSDVVLEHCIREIIQEYAIQNTGYEMMIKSLLFQLLVLLIRGHREQEVQEKRISAQMTQISLLKRVLSYIDEHYTEKITLYKLSEIAQMGKNHFCRTFKKLTGFTSNDYINRIRIDKARELLQSGNMNVNEVALACGFNDANYFCRLFKKYHQVSPSKAKVEKDN